MTGMRWVALLVLVAANTVVWRVRLAVPARGFDDTAFVAGVREAYGALELERVRFEDEGLLPQGYVYLEGVEEAPWASVYAGWFPGGGLLREEPHDPAVCYVALGWDIVAGPETIALPGLAITRLVVEREDERRTALYWQQRPRGGASWTAQLLSGRTDSVWVRVELEAGSRLAGELGAPLERRVLAVAAAAAAALP